jgi:hypothetical protein
MKFGQFSTKEASEVGRLWKVPHLETGAIMYETVVGEDGKEAKEPVGVWLRGMESETVKKAVRAHQKRNLSQETEDEKKQHDYSIAVALVVRFQHIQHDDGHLLQPTPEDIDWFFSLSSHFVAGAINFARTPGNFMAVAS